MVDMDKIDKTMKKSILTQLLVLINQLSNYAYKSSNTILKLKLQKCFILLSLIIIQ